MTDIVFVMAMRQNGWAVENVSRQQCAAAENKGHGDSQRKTAEKRSQKYKRGPTHEAIYSPSL